MNRRIGFVGAGLMGHGVAKNLLKHGHDLTVLGHVHREPIEDLLRRGAREAESAAELARGCEVIFTCLPDSGVVEKVLLGPAGVVEGARDGLVVVDLTTGAPSQTRTIAERLAAHGVRMLDAPMTLTPKEAEEGRLNLLVGGERALCDELRPLFDCFCARVFYIGPLGSAHTLKLINNYLALGTSVVALEAITTAVKAGVDPRTMREVISVSGGNSVAFQRMVGLVAGELVPGGGAFAIKNARKDIDYFWKLAESENTYVPVADTVRRFYHLAVALGYGDELLPRLFALQERLSQVELPVETSE